MFDLPIQVDVDNAIKVLESFSSSVRNFAAFVFAALIGIKFNDAQTNANLMLRRRGDKAPTPPAADVAAQQQREDPPPADDANNNAAPAPNAPNG